VQIIIAENIARIYRTGRGVNNVSFSVRTGQCFGVIGANGSGKTTLTRLVAGLDRTDSGHLTVLNAEACPRPLCLRRRCGIALDVPAHWDNLTGRQNLTFFARRYGLARAALNSRVEELLADADLLTQADEPVAEYSFGMRRKLMILQAICHDPDLLILDEPSAATDSAFRERLSAWIRQRCERGKTTWVADNNSDWLATAATNVILLHEGRVEAAGAVSNLIASVEPRNRIEVTFEHADFEDTPNIPGIDSFVRESNKIIVEADGDPSLPAALLHWFASTNTEVRSMEVRSMTLQDALIRQAAKREPES
jgi:ABC-2 type transport system ATP-binding protein